MFQNQNVPIMVKSVPVTAYCAHDTESNMFKIMGVEDACPDVIDIGEDVALGMCNTTDLESANALLDVGIALGAVSFLCTIDDYRRMKGQSKVCFGCIEFAPWASQLLLFFVSLNFVVRSSRVCPSSTVRR